MKKIFLFSLGLIPLGLGIEMHKWILANPYNYPPGKIEGTLFLAFWVLLGFMTSGLTESAKKTSNIVHSSALIILVLLLF